MPHRCLHSSATSLCRICTKLTILHDRVCSVDNLAPQPSQVAGISNGEWLYLRRTLSLYSSINRSVPFNLLGKTESHTLASQKIFSGHGGQEKFACYGAHPLEPFVQHQWCRCGASQGQTKFGRPQGTPSGGKLPQARPRVHSQQC